jgi:hypothetical protein
MSLSIEQADELLQIWTERLGRIDENLLALEADSSYQLVAGTAVDGRGRLEGLTREQLGPALDAVVELFHLRKLMGEMLDTARGLRTKVSFWNKEEVLAELEQVLCGPSIDLGERPVPLAARSLLQTGEVQHQMAVPDQLLEPMAESYRQARDAITALGRAWAELEPGLSRMEGEMAALRQRRAAPGGAGDALAGWEARLASVAEEVAAFSARATRDPLGVAGMMPSVEGRLRELAAELSALEQQRAQARAGLQKGRARLEQLVQLHGQASAISDEARAQVVPARGELPGLLDPALIEALEPWLQKLEATAAAGRSGAVLIGLQRWMETVDSYLESLRAGRGMAEQLLARRTELLGRLSARQAQVRALVQRGELLPSDVEGLTARTRELVTLQPTPLDEAEAALTALEAMLGRRGSSRGSP